MTAFAERVWWVKRKTSLANLVTHQHFLFLGRTDSICENNDHLLGRGLVGQKQFRLFLFSGWTDAICVKLMTIFAGRAWWVKKKPKQFRFLRLFLLHFTQLSRFPLFSHFCSPWSRKDEKSKFYMYRY